MNLEKGTIVDNRYRIESKLGEGGMGVVYKAAHIHFGNIVALKILNPYSPQKEASVPRFHREAKTLNKLAHPNIVSIKDFNKTDEHGWVIVMEYVGGKTLTQFLADIPKPDFLTSIAIIKQVLRGLAYFHNHEKKYIHRDIKPANIMLTGENLVKVMDFGLVKQHADSGDFRSISGQIMGTPRYMSPEQVSDSQKVDARTDIYATGMMLYEMLTGKRAYKEDLSYQTILYKIVNEDLPSPRHHNPDIPRGLAKIAMKAIHKNPAKRYKTAEALIADLEKAEKAISAKAAKEKTAIIAKNDDKTLDMPVPPRATSRRSPHYWLSLIAFVLLVAVAYLGITHFMNQKEEPDIDDKTETAVDQSVPDSVSVIFDILPKDAKVEIGGVRFENVANAIRLKKGSHPVKISAAGFIAQEHIIHVTADTLLVFSYHLEKEIEEKQPEEETVQKKSEEKPKPTTGQLILSVVPGIDSLFINGIYQRNLAQQRLRSGEYRFALAPKTHRIRVRSMDFTYWEDDVNIFVGQDKTVNIDFTVTIDVVITAPDIEPGSGEIWLNNEPTGKYAPKRLSLNIGMHRLEVVDAGGVSLEGVKTIFLKNGMDKSTVSFLRRAVENKN